MLVLMVHNRLDMFEQSLDSMFCNTDFQFSEVLICNDGSNKGTTKEVFDYVYRHSGVQDVNLLHFGKNQGQGCILEFILNYATYKNPKYLFLLEQDYEWRTNWAEEAVAVLENSPSTVMVAAQSHRGYYQEHSKNKVWPESMVGYFGEDPLPRHLMHKPFNLDIRNHKEFQIRDKIKVQAVSNTTTCNIISWRRFYNLRLDSNKIYNGEERFWKEVVRKACGIGMDTRAIVDDGILSQGMCYFWYKTYEKQIDKNVDFPILDICDYSIGNHLNEGGHHSAESYIGGAKWWPTRAGTEKWQQNNLLKNKEKNEYFVFRAPFNVVSGYGRLVEVIAEEIIKDDEKEIYFAQITEGLNDTFNKYKEYMIKKLPPSKFNCKELMISPM